MPAHCVRLDSEVSCAECFFTLPAQIGGLGDVNLIEMCDLSFYTSRKDSDVIVQTIKGNDLQTESLKFKEQQFKEKVDYVLNLFDQPHQQAIQSAKDKMSSFWLTGRWCRVNLRCMLY